LCLSFSFKSCFLWQSPPACSPGFDIYIAGCLLALPYLRTSCSCRSHLSTELIPSFTVSSARSSMFLAHPQLGHNRLTPNRALQHFAKPHQN
jgi:hypothetical protein